MNATIAAQMTGADILKLRKKRGILTWSLVVALAPILIAPVTRYLYLPIGPVALWSGLVVLLMKSGREGAPTKRAIAAAAAG